MIDDCDFFAFSNFERVLSYLTSRNFLQPFPSFVIFTDFLSRPLFVPSSLSFFLVTSVADDSLLWISFATVTLLVPPRFLFGFKVGPLYLPFYFWNRCDRLGFRISNKLLPWDLGHFEQVALVSFFFFLPHSILVMVHFICTHHHV